MLAALSAYFVRGHSAAMAAALSSLSARRYSTGMILRNFGYQPVQSFNILAAIAEPVWRAGRGIRWWSRGGAKLLRSDMISTRPGASRSRAWWEILAFICPFSGLRPRHHLAQL